MFCGLCEEACPEEAIVMSREVELATYDRDSMLYDKERLLVREKLLERRLSFLRAEYDREHAQESADGGPWLAGLRRLLDAHAEA
jgi:NADH-quinone oxidoreductase subunit I